jgi:hypothetical protein
MYFWIVPASFLLLILLCLHKFSGQESRLGLLFFTTHVNEFPLVKSLSDVDLVLFATPRMDHAAKDLITSACVLDGQIG